MSAGIPLDVAAGQPQRRARALAAELLRHWRIGQRPSVEAFAAEWDVRAPHELAAIVRADLRERWRRGERPEASEYVDRFPQLREDPDLVVDLLYAEFLAREELGDEPALDEFEARFPDQAGALRLQIEFHRALKLHEAAPPAADTRRSEIGPAATVPAGVPGGSRLPDLRPHYEITAEIGRGGMGVVYRANQVSLNRLVALKMVRAAEHASPELLARFRAEAEAVARLHHPQIVQIYDYGEHAGAPYLALELVEGKTLAAALDGNSWPVPQAAQLIQTLARAVHFAHQQGVIHRDLKPANILVAEGTGDRRQETGSNATNLSPVTCSLSPGSLKIADFGLAKVFGDGQPSNTETGAILGTPCYMAPEQAVGRSQEIGPATDVYALGAILYELLTGRPPFQAASTLETLQQVVAYEPVPPRRLRPRLPADLATICSKCLSKEPRQRYASAEELADDLERFLEDRPIQARPTTSLERGWRWCRRNPVVALLTGSVAALLLTVAAVSSILSLRLNAQLQKTGKAESAERTAKQTAQLRLFEAYLSEATAKHASRQIGQRFGTLETVDKANAVLDDVGRTPERVLRLRNATLAALALPDLRPLRRFDGWPTDGTTSVAFSAAADRYVTATTSGYLAVYRLSDGQALLRLEHHESAGPAISGDGKYLAANSPSGAKVWRIDEAPPKIVWEEAGTGQFTFSPDCRHAAISGADGQMHLLDLESGQKIRQLGRGAARSHFAFHQASQRIAVCTAENVQVLSAETGAVLAELTPPLASAVYPGIAWHPSGEFLAVSGYNDGVSLWRLATKRRHKAYAHRGDAVHCRFVAGGEMLLTHDAWVGHMHLWQTRTARELLGEASFHYYVGDESGARPHWLLAAEGSGLVLWEVEPGSECSALPAGLPRSLGVPTSVAISPDGRLLAVGRDSGLEMWDLMAREHVAAIGFGPNCFCRFADNGSLVGRFYSGVYRWPRHVAAAAEPAGSPSASRLALRFGPPERLCGATSDPKFAISPAADRLVVQEMGDWRVVSPASRDQDVRLGPQSDARMMSLGVGGRYVALGSWNSLGVTVYDSHSGARIAEIPVGPCADVLFSPNGRWLATSPSGVELWRTDNWQSGSKIYAHGTTPNGLGLAFSPDSRMLAVGQPTGETRLVDPGSGTDWATLVQPDRSPGNYIAFSPDQSRLVVQSPGPDAAPWVWDLVAIRRELARRRLDWPSDVLQPRQLAGVDRAASQRSAVTFDTGNLQRHHEAQIAVAEAGWAKTAAARDLLQKAIDLDPQSAAARNALAWLLAVGPAELRDPEQAVEHARCAVALGGASHMTLNTLGVALYRAGEHQEAVAVLNRSLATSPPHEAAFDLLFLGLCHAQRGEWPAANESYLRAAKLRDEHRQRWDSGMQAEWDRLFGEAQAAGLPH